MKHLKTIPIARWREDLMAGGGSDLPRFNLDIICHQHADGRLEGDPALFLAFRCLDLPRRAGYTEQDYNQDVATWMSDKDSAAVITAFTGIPIEDARRLINPDGDWLDGEAEPSMIKGREFVNVLDGYLATGIVDWSRVSVRTKPEAKPRRKRAAAGEPVSA